MCGSLLQKFHTCPLSLAVHQPGGVLGLTSDSRPAQRPVLSQDSAHGVLVVVQRHGPLGAEPLLVVPHEGAVADLGSCGGGMTQRRQEVKGFQVTLLTPGQRVKMLCVSGVGGLQRGHLRGGSAPASRRRTPASCHREAPRLPRRRPRPPSCRGSCSCWQQKTVGGGKVNLNSVFLNKNHTLN